VFGQVHGSKACWLWQQLIRMLSALRQMAGARIVRGLPACSLIFVLWQWALAVLADKRTKV
jgi:hypothetical protein